MLIVIIWSENFCEQKITHYYENYTGRLLYILILFKQPLRGVLQKQVQLQLQNTYFKEQLLVAVSDPWNFNFWISCKI